MKKYLLILAISMELLNSCKSAKSNLVTSKEFTNLVNYKIYKIDSINNYYLIYAKKENLIYKIVSKKVNGDCEKLKINFEYNLKLQPMGIMKPNIDDPKKRPMNYLDFIDPCRKFDNDTKICLERYMTDLYFSENLKGLCLIK